MSHTAPAIAQLLSPITHHLIDLSHDTGEHAHSIAQQNTIGRVVDIILVSTIAANAHIHSGAEPKAGRGGAALLLPRRTRHHLTRWTD
ncbi:MAG: hypothetical protein DMG57_15175 [Acidobacteria bacterium]|nr:MAG: hypothetical protein DMG57_15175 [Acidobacteriota bacterium]